MSHTRKQFTDLIDDEAEEQKIQRFLESRPTLLAKGKYLAGNAVISQFKLADDFRTDFAFVEPTSSQDYLHLVEIESPQKSIFRSDGQFTSSLNEARQQLLDWRQWVLDNQPRLMRVLEPLYDESGEHELPASFTPRGHLVIGRREEVSTKKRKNQFRSTGNSSTYFVRIRTYDGFIESCANLFGLVDDYEYGNEERLYRCVSYREQSFVEKDPARL